MESLITGLASSPWTPVLIEGRSAREIARRLHLATFPQKQASFVDVDCTWLPPDEAPLLLFGHERPPRVVRRGYVERANGGTLFLEDIADLPSLAQARLAKLLDTMQFRREGGLEDVQVSLRLITSVRAGIANALENSRLRRDLHSRLSILPIVIRDEGA